MICLKGFHILFLFIFGTAIGAEFQNHPLCGQTTAKFVVGGSDAKANEFPFMVSLQAYKEEEDKFKHFCGGTILNSRWVLTAAHCLKLPLMMGLLKKPSDIQLVIGHVDNLSYKNKGHVYKIQKWIINVCFLSVFGDQLNHDIALLEVTKDIDFSKPNVKPICLPPKNAEPIANKMTIAGWGVWSETTMAGDSKPPSHLQKANLELVSQEYCQIYQMFRNIGINTFTPSTTRLCLRVNESTACRGDSGGPAFQVVNGRIYQFGIASFISMTLPLGNRCYKSNPVVYLKTSRYIDWINQWIESLSSPGKFDISTIC